MDMMDKMPELKGRSHGGDAGKAQARRQALKKQEQFLRSNQHKAENEPFGTILEQEKSCSAWGGSVKD